MYGHICNYLYICPATSFPIRLIMPAVHKLLYYFHNWISDLESVFSQAPSKYYIETLEHAELLRISFKRLESLYHEVPGKERTEDLAFEVIRKNDQNTSKPKIDRSRLDVLFGSSSFFNNLRDKAIDDNFILEITQAAGTCQ